MSGIFCPVYFVWYILSGIFCPVCIVRIYFVLVYFVRYILSGIFCPIYLSGIFCLVYFVRYVLSGYILSWYILSGHGSGYIAASAMALTLCESTSAANIRADPLRRAARYRYGEFTAPPVTAPTVAAPSFTAQSKSRRPFPCSNNSFLTILEKHIVEYLTQCGSDGPSTEYLTQCGSDAPPLSPPPPTPSVYNDNLNLFKSHACILPAS